MKRFSTNARVMQRIDFVIGAPACFFLTIWRFFADRLTWSRTEPALSILFVKLAEQGSTVLAHDAIKAAVDKVGAANVYFLVFEENRFILDLLGLIPRENVFTVRTKSIAAMITTGLGRLWEIRRKRFLACIDMEFFSRGSSAVSYMTGARRRIGFHSYYGEGPYRGDLLTHRVLYNPQMHTSRVFMALVQAMDAPPERFPSFGVVPVASAELPRFHPPESEREQVKTLLEGLGLTGGRRMILLNANASDLLPLRKWDHKNYLELARRLLVEFDDVIIGFTGAPDEAVPIGELAKSLGSGRAVCLAGKTTLKQLLIVYGFAEVLVTNDSGPAHFAALTPVDTVVLFGPETPQLFAACTPRSHAIWAGLACSPCVNAFNNRQTACRDNVCMKSITVDQVYAAVCDIYRRRKNTPALAAEPTVV